MQILLDNLTAIIVSGILILGLQVTQIRSQHSAIEQVASHSVKAKTIVFGEWLEADVLDLGANYGTNMYRFEEPTLDADGNTTEWTFYSNGTELETDTGQLKDIRILKRYRLIPTTSASFRDTTFQLFRVERDTLKRYLDANGNPEPFTEADWIKSTRSISTLSFFNVELLDRMGQTPCLKREDEIKDADGLVVDCTGEIDVYKAYYVRVRFGVVPEYVLKPDNYIRELYWVKTLKVRPYWTQKSLVS